MFSRTTFFYSLQVVKRTVERFSRMEAVTNVVRENID